MKICFKCKRKLPLSMFYKHSGMKSGCLNKCKECSKIDVSRNYRNNIEHYKEFEKKRSQTPKRKEQVNRYAKKRREIGGVKVKATRIASNAIRDKRLIPKLKCEDCGVMAKLQAHHEDYNKPLEVVWLCFTCHRKKHGQLDYV